MKMLDAEPRILEELSRRRDQALESALLVISGCTTTQGMTACRGKIDAIFRRFAEKCTALGQSGTSVPPVYRHADIARDLFEYLWTSKPRRFGKAFLLAEVVDAHLDPDPHRPVGNCVGLTSLFSVLALRAGLKLSALVSPDHLLSRLHAGEDAIDLDHTDPQGFDCRATGDFHEFPLWTLVANVLNCRGLAHECAGNASAARSDYERAIQINPSYANAWNNRGNTRAALGDLSGAVEDYSEAIRIRPGFFEAYCNRGMARQRLGRLELACEDYRASLELRPDYGDALTCLSGLEQTPVGKTITKCVSPLTRKRC